MVYIPTLIVYVALQVPTALAGNLGTLFSMRFLGGFFASPCLAVGGATVIDLFEAKHVPYCLGIWGSLAGLG
jgi:MFS transporter, DHA1 family, multidrug resistance protein